MLRVVAHGVLCLMFVSTAATAVAAPIAEVPQSPTEMNWTRRSVFFSHQIHFKALGGASSTLCVSCHHPVDGGALHKTCATDGCHDNMNSRDTSVNSYYLATHKKEKDTHWSCVSCHERQAGEDADMIKKLAGCQDSVCHN